MYIAKDSTDSVTTSSDWPIPQIQNWHKCCLLDAFFVIPSLDVSGIIITLNFTEGQNLLFHLYSPLLAHSNPHFKTNQNYKSICSLGSEPQSPFISILHVSIPNCSVSGRLELCDRLMFLHCELACNRSLWQGIFGFLLAQPSGNTATAHKEQRRKISLAESW